MGQLGPNATTTEAHMPRAHAPQQEKPTQWEATAPQLESSPCLLQLEKDCAATKTQHNHKNKKKTKKKTYHVIDEDTEQGSKRKGTS